MHITSEALEALKNQPEPTLTTSSTNALVLNAEDKTAPKQKELTPAQKEIAIKEYYKHQINKLKPQVELAELRAKLQKAAYESYVYASKVDEFETGLQQKLDAEKTTEDSTSKIKGGENAN